MKKQDQESTTHLSGFTLCIFAAGLFFLCFTGCTAKKASQYFLEINDKFSSNAQSQKISEAEIDYGGKFKVVLNDGTLYRRRDSLTYDYYFLGQGQIIVGDTAGLTVSGQDTFSEDNLLEFSSAYICGNRLPELLGLDPSDWASDKIRRPFWNDLQFLLKAPDKHFGINPGAELGIWSDDEIFPLPVWIDMKLDDDVQMTAYLTPDISEQLHVYVYNQQYASPALIAGYNLGDRIVSRPIEIDSTEIFIYLKESGNFDARCKIYFATGDPAMPSFRPGLKMILPYMFTVDSVKGDDRLLPFIKKKRRNNFYLIRGDDPLTSNTVEVYYRGKYLKSPYAGMDTPVNMTGWFPHHPRRTLGRFILHYTLHKDLTLLSVGEKTEETIDGDLKTATYRTGDNISYVSFASGLYDTLTETAGDIPINLYVRRENNMGLFNRNKPKEVMTDLAGAFKAFHDRFGPPTANKLDIVDRAAFVGQSSPGLIHLSHISFETRRDQARFRAHEIAHQWWGHTAVPKTVRDMWLSEGLAEFSAGLYLLDHLRDTTAFRELLASWRKQVLEEGRVNGMYSRGYKAGSIWQGMRLLESNSPGDYMALVYAKAACMLRMLRFEIDGPSYKTDFFSAMLTEYLRSFHGRQASSADFERVAGQYIGAKQAKRFFHHWLYGWKIPEIKGSYTITADDRGRRTVEFDLFAEGMAEGFETPFPVEIEFADGSRRLFRLDGIGVRSGHLLGPFPPKIVNIRFDPDQIILTHTVEVHEKQ